MRKILYLFMVLMLVSCGSEKAANISTGTSKIALNTAKQTSNEASSMKISVQSIISEMGKGKYKEGELLVKFKSGVIGISSLKLHQAVGASVANRFTIVPNLELVKLPKEMLVKDAVIQYMSDPNVEYAVPNYMIRALSVTPVEPNDTYFPLQWALKNTGSYASGTPDADIKLTDAWSITTGSHGIIVAVLDTGIDYNHADLVNNMWINTVENPTNGIDDDGNGKVDDWRGWDFTTCEKVDPDNEDTCITTKSESNDPMDDNGHGTHVAGIIGATGNNGLGIAGVMWNVRLMPVKILNSDGQGWNSDEIEGINYAVNMGAKIINASYGGGAYSPAVKEALQSANDKGVLFVAAAGNGGEDKIGDNNDLNPVFPASYSDARFGGLLNIISVAATDQNDNRVSFSNFGRNSVHVAAPGVYILSTIPQNMYADKDFNWGTSMAAPHVSGLAGLLWSYYTDFNHYQIIWTILRYSDPKPSLDGYILKGRINAYRALSSLQRPENLTATAVSASQINLSWSDKATGEDGYKVERKKVGGSYITLDPLPAESESYIDIGLDTGTTYFYKVTAYNTIPAESIPSETSATTLTDSPPESSGGGGGGCTIGAKQNTPTAVADTTMLLIPLLAMAFLRRRR
jgi:thermitase